MPNYFSYDNYLKIVYVTQLYSYAKLTFDVKGLAKLTNVLSTILISLIDKIQQFNPEVGIVKYDTVVQKITKGLEVELDMIIKEVPTFIKF